MSKLYILIPARLTSTRLPGKLMADLAGKPVFAHCIANALNLTDSVYVATDSEEICSITKSFGGVPIMTSNKHNSGTDRLAEAVYTLDFDDDDIVVNLQGDEPLMPVALLAQVAELLEKHSSAGIATLMQRIECVDDLHNPNIVKVVLGEQQRALYFSRAPVPFARESHHLNMQSIPKGNYFRHIGLYAYRVKTLKAITKLPEHPLEAIEKLEQLRPLAHGIEIVVDEACECPEHGIDTYEDLMRVRAVLSGDKYFDNKVTSHR